MREKVSTITYSGGRRVAPLFHSSGGKIAPESGHTGDRGIIIVIDVAADLGIRRVLTSALTRSTSRFTLSVFLFLPPFMKAMKIGARGGGKESQLAATLPSPIHIEETAPPPFPIGPRALHVRILAAGIARN